MKKLFSLLLLVAIASAMTPVVQTSDGDLVLSSDNMAVRINTEQNYIDISGALKVPMFPVIKSKKEQVAISAPQVAEVQVGSKLTTYTVSYPENFAGDVFGSAIIEITDDVVEQTITIENSGDNALNVEVEVLPLDRGVHYIFAPYKRAPTAKYLWISPAIGEERAEGVIVAFTGERPTFDQPQEVNMKTNFIRTLAWTVPLDTGEIKTIVIKYRPGYVNDDDLIADSPYSPPYSKQYVLHTESDALFDITGEGATDTLKPQISETSTGLDAFELFKQTLDAITDTPTSESTLTTLDIDMGAVITRVETGLSSVEKALMFREMARRQGLPAEIRVGHKEGNYYAWAVGYVGTTAFTYDPAGKSADYTQVYREPEPANCRGEMYECPWSSGIQEGLFCIGSFCLPAIALIALFVVAFVMMFVVFQYRTDIIYQILGTKKGAETLAKDDLDGAYAIVSESYLPKDPLERSVWDALRRRNGAFKSKDYVTETGFSEVLVKAAIEKFVEKDLIRKSY